MHNAPLSFLIYLIYFKNCLRHHYLSSSIS